jgi:hypothetical protein
MRNFVAYVRYLLELPLENPERLIRASRPLWRVLVAE